MRWRNRGLLWGLLGLLAVPVLILGLLIWVANTPFGRTELARAVSVFSENQIVLNGLGGDFPAQLTVKRIDVFDAGGPWLTIHDLNLDWHPAKLLLGEVAVKRLEARQVTVARAPLPATAEPEPPGGFSLPLAIHLNHLRVEQVEMAPAFAGKAINLSIGGKLALTTAFRGEVELDVRQTRGDGAYHVQYALTKEVLQASLSLHEGAHGPLATLTGRQSLSLDATLDGPLSRVAGHMELKLDELQAHAGGTINFVQPGADFAITASAPAMQLRPDLAWQSLALNLQTHGALAELNLDGGLKLDGLRVAQTTIGGISVKWLGRGGRISLNGQLADLRLASSPTDILQKVPLTVYADIGLDKAEYPIQVELKHPLAEASANIRFKDQGGQAELVLNLPDLGSLAAITGLQLDGHGRLTLKAERHTDDSKLEMAGSLALGGASPWAKLLGESAKFDLSAAMEDEDITLSRLQVDGKAISLSAHGEMEAGVADLAWQAQLGDVSAITEKASGKLSLQGSLKGERGDLTLVTKLDGNLASRGYPGGPIDAHLQLKHLPELPEGRIDVAGKLIGAPIDMRVVVDSPGGNAVRIGIEQAAWKSLRALGGVAWTRDGSPPSGKITLKINHLADFRPLLNQALTGSATASLEMGADRGHRQAKVSVASRNAGLEGVAKVDSATLALTVDDPAAQASLNGLLTLNGIEAGRVNASAQLKIEGPLDKLGLGLSANSPDLNGSEAQLTAGAQLNVSGGSLAVRMMEGSWHRQTLRLLAPANIAFADGLSVDRLRLGLEQAELEIAGQLTPELALNAELHETPAELISLFAPDLPMNGVLHADAELTGTLAQPRGLIRFRGDKLQMKQGAGRGLPPARIDVNAALRGEVADLDAKLTAGNDMAMQISGRLPTTQSGPLALQGQASVELKRLNPLLSAEGRQVRGRLIADMQLAGAWSSPLISANARLGGGGWQDRPAGIGIKDIVAELQVENGTLRIGKLQGRAGEGTLSATGSASLSEEGVPVNLTLTARNAKPLAGERLTANLDADLTVNGLAAERLNVAGRIRVNRADIRIPERMPTNIAVLKFDRSGHPPPPPETKADIALDLTIEAPREIFVRGRGLDAELGGAVHVAGTLQALRPEGAFHLRRGEFSLAGQTLVFNQGEVGFDSGSLTNPSLNFVATTNRNDISASLTVSGSALQPKISLSSTPQLPQDEILANLLFGKGTAGLSPLEMVQIASTLASLTGVTAGTEDPLESARKRLGLDRLSAGGANPSVEGGRYIAPGVYLGAKQGVSGGTPQAVIQIDVMKGLKLESTVGNVGGLGGSSSSGTSSTNSIGVVYQFEY